MTNTGKNNLPEKHLHESVRPYLELSDEERIIRIQSPRWIGYGDANQILQRLEELFRYPKSNRMPNLLIVGRSNNGKSEILHRFAAMHPADDNPAGDGISVPVLYTQIRYGPDIMSFYSQILRKLFAPQKAWDRIANKESQIISMLERINLKMLLIDEIHNILSGRLDRQIEFLSNLRTLGNELRIPIVAAGIKDAYRAIQTDAQLANRFEPMALPVWEIGMETRRLLASFEMLLPLRKPSNLSEPNMAASLITMSEGTIGDLSMLLNRAAIHAIKTKREQITPAILAEIDWIPPSQRKQQPDKITI